MVVVAEDEFIPIGFVLPLALEQETRNYLF